MENELNLRLPKTDSATGRGLKTTLWSFIGSTIVLGTTAWAAISGVPGCPEVITNFVRDNLIEIALALSVPSGVISFVYNWLGRSSVRTY